MVTVVSGVIHPEPSEDPNEYGESFRPNELALLVKKFVGVPVFREHDWQIGNPAIGQVVKAYIGLRNKLIVDIRIDHQSEHALKTVKELEAGHLKGLSTGIGWRVDEYGRGFIYDAIPKEVSICKEGRFPTTDILSISNARGTSLNLWAGTRLKGGHAEVPSNYHTCKLQQVIHLNSKQQKMATNTDDVAAKLAMAEKAYSESVSELQALKKKDAERELRLNSVESHMSELLAEKYDFISEQTKDFREAVGMDQDVFKSMLGDSKVVMFLNSANNLYRDQRQKLESLKTPSQKAPDTVSAATPTAATATQPMIREPPPPPTQNVEQTKSVVETATDLKGWYTTIQNKAFETAMQRQSTHEMRVNSKESTNAPAEKMFSLKRAREMQSTVKSEWNDNAGTKRTRDTEEEA